jgi:hypothetical protein
MSKKIWILLTDGYYIKIIYVPEGEDILRTYREADFDNSSDLTYNLITRYKNPNNSVATQKENNDYESPIYLLALLSGFLEEKRQEGTFNSLIIVAPDNVQELLGQYLTSGTLNLIKHKVIGDYLNLSLDKLQDMLANKILAKAE